MAAVRKIPLAFDLIGIINKL